MARVLNPRDTPPTYRRLFAVAGFGRLAGAGLVARSAASMQALVLVLFVLERFRSPPLAGLVVFLSIVPGLLISPVAGALLDRHRRVLLITLDYVVAAIALGAVAGLDAAGHLPAGALLGIVSIGSLTSPLSNSGTRSLFPVLVPRRLWERANAVDSGAFVVAGIAGPALAGVLFGVVGAVPALLATAALYLLGVVLLQGMAEPDVPGVARRSLAADAYAGLRYVVRHRELRGLAVVTALSNVAFGIVTVGMPVLLLSQLHVGPGSVGVMYAVMGVAGLIAGALAGRMNSEDREVWFIVAGCVATVVSMVVMLAAAGVGGGLVAVAVAMALFGIGNGPYDIGMFSLRQRVIAPAWMGRAFAVSMSLNYIGAPIGSVLAGPIVVRSLAVAFAVAVLAVMAATVLATVMLRPPHGGGSGTAPDGEHHSEPVPARPRSRVAAE
ncbi:MAG TPA: MFS transporter [Candidatus Dormibacteraeota bacterium]|nr:MFS transporter [Candidatus Dormibacteraeota bacterium]